MSEVERENDRLRADVDDLRKAVGSLLDIVDELTQGSLAGTKPDAEWVAIVHDTLEKHQYYLGFKGF